IALPGPGLLASVSKRRSNLIKGTAIVILGLKTVGVENLNFVPALQIDATVSALLPLCLRHVRKPKCHVELKVTKVLLSVNVSAIWDHFHRAVSHFPSRRSALPGR